MVEAATAARARAASCCRRASASSSARRPSPSAACRAATSPVADPNVSRKHAEIRPSGDGYVVIDLGSTNGTKVNGATVSERKLGDGDEIAVGTTRLRFEAS